ncbi:MAG: (Fe-S)-binding protein [Desulfosarcinaceae bacterium]|nr:(Fe-S)-binding protein [Desulfosarcinaceae bacterium]
MLLDAYRLEIFNSECNPGAMSVHCKAILEQDIAPVLPYLNASLGGFEYVREPPSVTFRSQGKLITVHRDKIMINALRDGAEARKIVEWLKREINTTWEQRASLTPSYEGLPRPSVMTILKALPKTNCRRCGEATCMVFAVRMAEGVKSVSDCPPLVGPAQQRLAEYMDGFHFDM